MCIDLQLLSGVDHMKMPIIFIFSFAQAAVSTFFSIALALPLAHFFNRFTLFGKKFFLACAALLCIMPTKLIALSVSMFYGIDGFFAILFAHLLLNLPFSFYVLNLAYQNLIIPIFGLQKI